MMWNTCEDKLLRAWHGANIYINFFFGIASPLKEAEPEHLICISWSVTTELSGSL